MACFYVTISQKFEHFQYFNFETDFLENENFSGKTGVTNIFLSAGVLFDSASSLWISLNRIETKL